MIISLATFLESLLNISVALTFAPQNFKLLTCEVTSPQIIVRPIIKHECYIVTEKVCFSGNLASRANIEKQMVIILSILCEYTY